MFSLVVDTVVETMVDTVVDTVDDTVVDTVESLGKAVPSLASTTPPFSYS